MNTIENGSSLRQRDFVNGFIEDPKANIYVRLLKLDDTSLKVLKIVGENEGIQSKLLQEKVNLSRAPILQRTKAMSDGGLLIRSILAGTENHSKPTYCYSLSPDVPIVAINCAIAKLTLEDFLALEGKVAPEGSTTLAGLGGHPNTPSPTTSPSQVFEVMQELLEPAFRKITELENRLERVEAVLRQPSTFDREKLLNILKPCKD